MPVVWEAETKAQPGSLRGGGVKQDADLQPLYCRWAEQKYRMGRVEQVRFDFGYHGPYSEVTPDVDAYARVSVKTGEGWVDFEECYLADLIADVARFAESRRMAVE